MILSVFQDILKFLEETSKTLPSPDFLQTFLIVTAALMAFATAFLFSLIFHTRTLMYNTLECIFGLLERLGRIRYKHEAGETYFSILTDKKNYTETATDKFLKYLLIAALTLAILCIISIGLFGFALADNCPILFLYLLLTIQLFAIGLAMSAGWYFKPYKQINTLRKLTQQIQNYLIRMDNNCKES